MNKGYEVILYTSTWQKCQETLGINEGVIFLQLEYKLLIQSEKAILG